MSIGKKSLLAGILAVLGLGAAAGAYYLMPHRFERRLAESGMLDAVLVTHARWGRITKCEVFFDGNLDQVLEWPTW